MLDRRAFVSGMMLLAAGCTSRKPDIVVGSKNFTEQLILGELFEQLLERSCQAAVDGRFYLAGTYICQQAILAGRIDVYPEYTGTALAAVLKESASGDARASLRRSQARVPQKFRSGRDASAGLRQQLCHGDARRRCATSRPDEAVATRSRGTAAQAGSGLRVSGAAGRLCGASPDLRPEVCGSTTRDGSGFALPRLAKPFASTLWPDRTPTA